MSDAIPQGQIENHSGAVPSNFPARETLREGDRLSRDEFERRYEVRPDLRQAELIEGIVRMPTPVGYETHANPHSALITVLSVYAAHTPGVGVAVEATVRLDPENEPQPDVVLRIESDELGQSSIDADGYIAGAPELVAEIAASSARFDLGQKLEVYRRNGVREYIVWQTRARRIDCFQRSGEAFEPLPVAPGGIVHSQVFPGLRIATAALLKRDVATALAVVQRGVGAPEHGEFVARCG